MNLESDSEKQKCRVISVVSGKGGCGKTLLTAVIGQALAREGIKVLIIDLDIFVRGLTILFSNYLPGGLHAESKITVSDLLLQSGKVSQDALKNLPKELAVSRFFECDMLPACESVGAPIDYGHVQLSSFRFCKSAIKKILSAVRERYDIILLDNRASIDSLVLAASKCSDVVISVAEDDDLSLQTNSNLVNDFRYHREIKNVYTLINKGRRITSYDDVKKGAWRRIEFNYVGVIPFDIEIMQDFGKDRFWRTLNDTLYFRAIIDAWNTMAAIELLKPISLERYRFPPSIFMSKKGGRLPLMERMLRLYSIMFISAGVVIFVYRGLLRGGFNSSELLPFSAIAVGVVLLILSTTGIRRWLLGKSDEPRRKD